MQADEMPARLTDGGHFQCPPGWRLTPHRTRKWRDLDLWVLVRGRGFVITPEGKVDLEPGACLLMRGGEPYHFHPSQPFVHYWAHFDYMSPQGERVDHNALALPPRFRQLNSPRLVNDLFERMVESIRPPDSDRRRANRWLMALLSEVARVDRRARMLAINLPHQAQLDAHRERILADPGGDHRIQLLAESMGVDPSHYCRLFAGRFGISPRQFVTAARMDMARYLLRDTTLPVHRIAIMLGYQDLPFFSRHFHRHQGLSPTAYRHQKEHP